MGNNLKSTLLGGVLFVAGSLGLPVIPDEMELLYSFQCPCDGEVLPYEEPPEYYSKGDEAVAVFADRKGNKVFIEIPKEEYQKMGEVAGILDNPKKNEYLTVFEALVEPKKADAAVVRGSELFVQAITSTSLTFAFNNVAGDVLYVYGHDRAANSTVVTSVTYAGSGLTKILEQNGSATQNDRAITLWRKIAPATGSNNVVVSVSSSQNLRFSATSLTGANQTTPENGTDTSGGDTVSTISTDITPSADNCWMMMFSKDSNGNRTYTNTTGDSIRLNTDAGGHLVVDTNGTIANGVQNTITNTMTATDVGALAWTICPASAAGYRGQPTIWFE